MVGNATSLSSSVLLLNRLYMAVRVISAKRAETRESRLATLIEDSAAGRRIKQLRPQKSNK